MSAGMTIDYDRLNTPQHQIRMARIFLYQSRYAVHRNWSFTLLEWAGERRRKAMDLKKRGPMQADLFGGAA